MTAACSSHGTTRENVVPSWLPDGAPSYGGAGGAGSVSLGGQAPAGGAAASGFPDGAGPGADAGAVGFDAGAAPPAPPAYLPLFAAETLPTFEITLPQASFDALRAVPTTYQPGSLRYESTVVDNIGVRVKGRASFRPIDEKPSFKLSFNEYVPGQRFFGLRRLTLNNLVQDPSFSHERIGYRYLRALGVPAPLCNSARVYVNGVFYGLYTNVQTLDDEFLEDLYGRPLGNLYDQTLDEYFIDLEPGNEPKFQLETNVTMGDTSDLTRLFAAMNGPDATFVADAESMLDLGELLLLSAGEAVMADWDGYAGATNNYKIYHELVSDRFVMLPWGIDQTFGIQDDNFTKMDYPIDHSQSERPQGLVFTRCLASAECAARYVAAVRQAVDAWDVLPLAAELDQVVAQISQSVTEDTRKATNVPFDVALAKMRDFLTGRSAAVRAQLP